MLNSELLHQLSRKMVTEPTNYMESFRKNLLTFIEHKDISLNDIAEKADMSVETLKSLVYGKSNDCKLSTAVSLARALELSVDELVGSGILSPKMRESIQITRNLPPNYVSFVRWLIRYQEMELNQKVVTGKAINVMYAECAMNGNLLMNYNYELMDITDLPEGLLYKIFMGIKIPCEHYMPILAKGDILLLANDRNPLQNEMVVVVTKGRIRIVRRKNEMGEVGYYSIRNGAFMDEEVSPEDVIGYVVKVMPASDNK